jgi:hypothetical protein
MVNLLLVNHTQSLHYATPQRTNQWLTSAPAKIPSTASKIKILLWSTFLLARSYFPSNEQLIQLNLCDLEEK